MRYGVRYNPNKRKMEFLDIDEIDEHEIIASFEASDYYSAQTRFNKTVNSISKDPDAVHNLRETLGVSNDIIIQILMRSKINRRDELYM